MLQKKETMKNTFPLLSLTVCKEQ